MEKRSFVTMQSLPSHIMLGNIDGIGREAPDTLITINVTGKVTMSDFVEVSDKEIEIQLALTPVQIAYIVKLFFWDIIHEKIYGKMLKRLLIKRWATMTSSLYKSDDFSKNESRKMRYFKSLFAE